MNNFITAGRRIVGNETIDFQKDSFGHDIEAIMTKAKEYLTKGKKIKDSHDLVEELEILIFQRLGLKTSIHVNEDDAAIIPFYHNTGHIFLSDWMPGIAMDILGFEKLVKKTKLNNGTVNATTAKLTGIFSEFENDVYINLEALMIVHGMSPAECAAILLHELGHGFYACEYATRQERCNQVLVDIAKAVQSKEKKKTLTYVYKEVEDLTGESCKEEIDSIVNGNNIMVGPNLFLLVTKLVKSQMTNTKYDETSFEALSDNFAARFGYGRELITGLDKLYSVQDREKNINLHIYMLAIETIKTGCAFAIAIGSILAIGPSIVPIIVIALLLSIFRENGDQFIDMTYDELKHRYKRIRQAMIEELKQTKVPTNRIKEILASIQTIDKIISETIIAPSLYRVIGNIIFTSNKEAKRAIAEQKLVEELASNDLFLKAAQLKTLHP